MTTQPADLQPALLEPGDYRIGAEQPRVGNPTPNGSVELDEEPLRPINWNLLTSEEAEAEWLDLNAWVHWLRTSYGLPPAVIPPYWHRHDELVWELSALHTHWLNAYDPEGSPSSPLRGIATSLTRATGCGSGSRRRARSSTVTVPHGSPPGPVRSPERSAARC